MQDDAELVPLSAKTDIDKNCIYAALLKQRSNNCDIIFTTQEINKLKLHVYAIGHGELPCLPVEASSKEKISQCVVSKGVQVLPSLAMDSPTQNWNLQKQNPTLY